MKRSEAYAVLGVQQGASDKEIKKAYRKASSKAHPDKGGSDEEMQKVNAANDILTGKTPADDDGRSHGFDSHGFNMDDIMSQFGGFNGFSGYGRRILSQEEYDKADPRIQMQAKRDARGDDQMTNVAFSLEDIYFGNTKEIQLGKTKVKLKIPEGIDEGNRIKLQGKGAPAKAPYADNGDLYIVARSRHHPVYKRDGVDLYAVVSIPLFTAMFGGTIHLPTFESDLKVKIPAGSNTGMKLVLRDKGMKYSGYIGNIIVVLNVEIPNAEGQEEELMQGIKDLSYPETQKQINNWKNFTSNRKGKSDG